MSLTDHSMIFTEHPAYPDFQHYYPALSLSKILLILYINSLLWIKIMKKTVKKNL